MAERQYTGCFFFASQAIRELGWYIWQINTSKSYGFGVFLFLK